MKKASVFMNAGYSLLLQLSSQTLTMPENAISRLLASALCGIAGFAAGYFVSGLTFGMVIGWDIFAFAYLCLSLRVFSKVKSERIKKMCASEDDSTWVLFSVVVTACTTSLFIVLALFDETSHWGINSLFAKICCVLVVVFSWIMLHLSFTFRYAHLYYGDENERYAEKVKGLDFPGNKTPDYFDFAYFSFVIGMTFQVSDVVITSSGIRKLVLVHSLISFLFNTVIVALTVSQVISLGH